jgi:pathogenesis-related protein 1
VDVWAGEKDNYDYASNRCAAGKICGHYTQVVWAATERVGCGLAQCAGLAFGATIVCNYSPAGNSGGRPY